MKTLTKLALVSAMAFSANAMAAQLQALDEEEMSAATGQDGITIALSPAASGNTIIGADLVIHDRGGLQNLTSPAFTRTDAGLGGVTVTADAGTTGKLNNSDGAIVLDNFLITSTSTDKSIKVRIDADSGVGGTAPVLNVNVGLPDQLTVTTGNIYVAASKGINAVNATATNATALGDQVDTASQALILSSFDIGLDGASLNIQLGNQPQGALIKLNSSIAGGLSISNLNILQGDQTVTANGGIGLGKINIKSDATKWDLAANINAKSTGLEISNLGTVDVRIENLRLGNLNGLTATNAPLSGTAPAGAPAALGQVALLGLALPNVTISGH